MCDTFVALPRHTALKHLIFGKNSDREPNEAQAIVRVPACEHQEKELRCTYISIPQVRATREVLLSKPFQMWGAEMGVNDQGVVIGNEAVFTKVQFKKKNLGLTGMDLLRLALERTATAEGALECITALLAEYGQDACGGYHNRHFFYHNSFLIADASDAWVLETAGRHWAAQRVQGFRSISNGLTIEEDYDLLSDHAIEFARQQGWQKKGETFSFRRAFSDWFYTRMSSCRMRQATTESVGRGQEGSFTVEAAMQMLEYHHPGEDQFQPHRATTASVCMHPTGLANPSQTNGAMVAEVRRGLPATVWLTGTSMPCLSVFKPFFFGGRSLAGADWPLPGPRYDGSLWWKTEDLHRAICRNYRQGRRLIASDRANLQRVFLEEEQKLLAEGAGTDRLDALSYSAIHQYWNTLRQWKDVLIHESLPTVPQNPFYRYYFYRNNKKAGLPG